MEARNFIIQAKAAEEIQLKLGAYKRKAMLEGKSNDDISDIIMGLYTPHIGYDELLAKINNLLNEQGSTEIRSR